MEIELYTPHSKQLPVHEALNDDTTFIVTVNAGRQAGKTKLSQQQALYWALNFPGRKIYWVSPTSGQASKVYDSFLELIVESPFIKSYRGNPGNTQIIFKNNSIIKFRSAAQGDALRGETIDYMIVDEAASIKEIMFNEVLFPMVTVKGKGYKKKCLIISTPKGKNWFFHIYNRGFGDDINYKSFRFTSADNPLASPETIKIARDSIPDVLFRQEYLGEFVDSAAIFENINELATLTMINKPVPGDSYYIGVDIALKGDYNVVAIFNQKDELVYYDRVNNISAPELKERMIKIFNLWKPKKIFIEENNQGLPIIQDLKQIHKIRFIEGFSTTSSSKPMIINHLINAFASKKIRIVNDDIVKAELEMFTMSVSETGTVKFMAPSGFNDDIVMAIAIGWHCLQQNKNKGVDFSFGFVDI